ncbi:unnamed protein product [Miscanthus lutarioriparius]|uniref:Uncharacterized protein n=1 Tax=Miscanthus lutarioriparius TaxID=422564 RepID=A0A811Q792_9POAL|nr:unnamed protein product [Miscanthus lutarioriparius]CAD6255039.1 unnamed protein product [Miscanthus lutarioriparius]
MTKSDLFLDNRGWIAMKKTKGGHFGVLMEILKSPVTIVLNEEATAWKVPCWLDPQRPESQLPVDTKKFNKRFLWYHEWASEIALSLQTLQQSNGSIIGVPTA